MTIGLNVLNIGIMAQKRPSVSAGTISITAASDIYWDGNTGGCCDTPTFNVIASGNWAYSGGAGIFTASPASGSAGTTSVTLSYAPDVIPEDYVLTFYLTATPGINATTHQWGRNGCA